jgi:hypothetical protein
VVVTVLAAAPVIDVALLPYPPGNEDLGRAGPAANAGERSPLSPAGRALLGAGFGACAILASSAAWPSPEPIAPRVEAGVGFALASASAAGALLVAQVARAPLPVVGLHAILVLGPGGAGLSLAGRF